WAAERAERDWHAAMNGSTGQRPASRVRRARMATFLAFGMLGGTMYTWATGVTLFRNHLGLTGSAGALRFGMIVLTAGAAAAVGWLVMGFIVDHTGPRAA